jgi:hypothetical protein
MIATMPGYAHFVWLLFMQPITLRERLEACGVDEPGISAWKWWRQRRTLHANYRVYRSRLLVILLLPVLVWLLLARFSSVFHLALPLAKMVVYVVTGVMLGVGSSIRGSVAGGVASGVATSAILSVFGVELDWGHYVALSAAIGGGVAVGQSVGDGIADGTGSLTSAMANAVSGGVISAVVIGGAGFVWGNVASGIACAIAGSVCYFAVYLQLHLYLLEVPLQFFLSLLNLRHPNRTLAFSPVLFHNPIYFPLPGLTAHIIAAANHEPALAQRVIQATLPSPGVHAVANAALAQLEIIEIGTLLNAQNFAAINTLKGVWLTAGPFTTDYPLHTLSEAARFMLAAKDSVSPYIAQQHLAEVQARLQELSIYLATSRDIRVPHLHMLLTQWQQILATTRQATEAQAANVLPNPFVPGNPLSPNMRWGRDVFRGREAIIDEIELLLADRNNSASLALIGPRRCGKSSLIKMLPILLPDTVVVEFSLLGHPADTPAAFYQALAQAAQTQALHQRRVHLPVLPDESTGSPIEVLKQWFTQLENFTEVSRILICIDEFERIETLFPDHGRQLQQFMGLLRATIQDCRRLRLLVAGTASFDDLGKIWNDNFINLRELRVGHLAAPAAEGLLQAPIPNVPFDAIPLPVAQAIFQRTQGQPFLTQAFAYVLVNQLNQAKRKVAELDDIDEVEIKVLAAYKNYFKNAWEETPEKQQAILLALAQQEGNPANTIFDTDKNSRRWLRRRLMINENDQLLVPTFARWLRELEDRE